MTEPAPIEPRLSGAPWLTDAARVIELLEAAGFEARFVGGVVRNALLGLPVTDVDIATTARPEAVMAAAQARGLKSIPTGIDHGTVTVVAGEKAYEVTTLREDVETDGRRARVAYTADWAADARRRDFTINALYCDQSGRLHDPIGGRADLEARRVRFIGDAHARIREDYLRILRFYRFFAAFGEGPIDRIGFEATIAERRGLGRLAAERIRSEVLRLLLAPRAGEAVAAMHDAGLWPQLIGLAPRPGLLDDVITLERALGRPGDQMLRLSALAVASEEARLALSERLRLSNAERERLVVVDGMDRGLLDGHRDPVALYHTGAEAFTRALIATAAARPADIRPTDVQARLARAADWQRPAFPLRGEDVLALGVPPGPEVGALLARLENEWITAGFPSDPAPLRSRLSVLVSAFGQGGSRP